MRSEQWLNPALVLPALSVSSIEQLLDAVAERVSGSVGIGLQATRAALAEALAAEGWSLGGGVGIPHAGIAGLREPVVCLVVTRQALPLPAIDGRAPDIFFFILAPPDDPEGHLLLLARLAGLAHSRTLIEGLRRVSIADDMVALIRAAELRHVPASPVAPASGYAMIVIAIAGENAVDALLVELLNQGMESATLLEAQSIREATTREVPLFTGFQDIFGDPGGRRVIMVDAPASEVGSVLEMIQRISVERKAVDVRVSVIPIQKHWQLLPVAEEEESAGHV
jgi:nitrogen PTS system EIIA component